QISPPTGYVPIGDGGTAIVVIGTGGTTGNPVITPISPNSDIIKNAAEFLKTDDADVRGAFDLSGLSISEGGTARINIETILNNGEKAEYLKLIHGLSGGTFEELPITITNQNGNQITGYATTTSASPFILVYEEGGAVNTTEPTKTQTAAPTSTKTEKPAVTVTETAAVNTTAEPTAKAESPIGLVWLAAGLLGAVIVLRRK
ncbi:MAG: hypothetical protein Q4Q53_06905, partial [Methanocorpusculum sp.]|nr:hypothetical protein [Methanocorpusculum sp.]